MTTIDEVLTADVALENIKTNGNVRKFFDDARMKELSESIKQVGVLQPVILRPGSSGDYQLVAGERRLRAAKMAGLSAIPARIMELSDQAAAEVQAVENIQRKDLTPIEEAQAFKQLMDGAKWTAEDLAGRVNKDKNYVYRAIRLLDLPDPVVELIHLGKLAPAHGHQLLRVDDKKQQEQLARSCAKDGNTAKELREHIDEKVGKNLAKAPFPKDEPYAGKVACAKCPLNSGNQGDLFDGVEKGRCTGPKCFQDKMEAYVGGIVTRAKEQNKGMKFLGVFDSDYSVKNLPGTQHVPASAAVKSLMKKDEAAYSFAVVREWDNNVKVLYYARLTPALRKALGYASATHDTSGGPESADRERPGRMDAVDGLVHAAIRRAYWEKMPDLPTAKDIRELLGEMIEDSVVMQALMITPAEFGKFTDKQMLKVLWFVHSNYEPVMDKIDRKAIGKRVRAMADKVWPKTETPACQVCGCTPHKACDMEGKRGGGCWWVVPGLCSACQEKGKTLKDAKPAAKAK